MFNITQSSIFCGLEGKLFLSFKIFVLSAAMSKIFRLRKVELIENGS